MAPKAQYEYQEVATGTMVVVLDLEDYVFKTGIAHAIERNGTTGLAERFEVVIRTNGRRQFLDVQPGAFRGGFDTPADAEAHAAHLNRTD